jgi:hypothetical protein
MMGYSLRRYRLKDNYNLIRGVAGGLLGGQVGAVVSVALFGMGTGANQLSVFAAAGLGYGIAVAPIGKLLPCVSGAAIGVIAQGFLSYHPAFGEVGFIRGPAAVIFNALGMGVAGAMAIGLMNRHAPARGMQWSPTGLLYGSMIGLVIGFVAFVQVGSTAGALIGLFGVISGGFAGGLVFQVQRIEVTKATTPLTVLARDRSAFWAAAIAPSIAVGGSTGLAFAILPDPLTRSPFGIQAGVGIGAASFLTVSLVLGFLQASWGAFTFTRIWLAVTGKLPWRLMHFLDDAHQKRGVLRQVGAVYQFRHVELQRRLTFDTSVPNEAREP